VTSRLVGPIAAAVIVQSAGNLGLHAALGRILDADAYGALGAVLAAMVLLGVPLGALQTAASAVATTVAARQTLGRVALWSVPVAAAVLACAPALRDFFRLDGWGSAALLAPYLLVSAVLATARGLLLGARRTGPVAASYLMGTVVRLGLGVALAAGWGVPGALLGTLAGEAAALAVAAWRLTPPRRRPAADRSTPPRVRTATGRAGPRPAGQERDGGSHPGRERLRLGAVGRAGVAVTGLFLFSTVDLFLARHHLRGEASGAYVAAATIAKTVLAVPAAIMSAVFPRLVAAWPGGDRRRALLGGAVSVTGPALLGAVAVVAMPSLVLGLLYGGGYAEAGGLVRALSAVAALTSAVTLMTNAALARRAWTVALPWAGAVLEAGLIERWHATAGQVAACSAAALAPTLLLAVVLEGRAWTRPTPQPGPAPADSPATEVAPPAEEPRRRSRSCAF
jgi:O-antigen/teichoic acid export membrane protein